MADTIEACHVKWTTTSVFRNHKWQIPSKFVMWSGPNMEDTIEVCHVKWNKTYVFSGPWMANTIEVCHVKWKKTSLFWRPEMADTIEVCHVKWTKNLYFRDPKLQIPSRIVMWSRPKTFVFGALNGRYHRSLSCEVTKHGRYLGSFSCEVDRTSVFSGPWMADTIEVCHVKWSKQLYFGDPN